MNVLRNFRFKLVLRVVWQAETISGISYAIRGILGWLWAVEVVKTASAGSSICPVNKSDQRTKSIRFHVERAF